MSQLFERLPSRRSSQGYIDRDDRIRDFRALVRRPATADLRARRDLRAADRVRRASARTTTIHYLKELLA